jgi:hypothetical protein
MWAEAIATNVTRLSAQPALPPASQEVDVPLRRRRWRDASILLFFIIVGGLPHTAAGAPNDLRELYSRIAADLKAGKPVIVTVHVALCDNNTINCGTRPHGDGDQPKKNLYWGGAAGFRAYFNWRRPFRRIHQDNGDGDVVLERVVYRYRVKRSNARLKRLGIKKAFDIYLVGLAYRGRHIGKANLGFIKHVQDGKLSRRIKIDDKITIDYGRGAHVIGYAGHNHMMDVTHFSFPPSTRQEAAGFFALSCINAPYLSELTIPKSSYGLLLTRTLMYPGAFTIEGIVEGVAKGESMERIRRRAVGYYAKYQHRPVSVIGKLFVHEASRRFLPYLKKKK